ncbi:MAG TPA: BrnA antitoxin family protein [Microvirga sp.]|jgi:uncharacterized protein (DUF4415 family)|nr:BrnA antitoxin family protein [Microvirga sp.]
MSKPPSRKPSGTRHAAEAAFKSATTKPADLTERPKGVTLPPVRELVSLRLDRDVLEHFQADGPGWQERMSAALRAAAGIRKHGPQDEGLRPDQLTSENGG